MSDAVNEGGPAFPSHGSMGEVAHQGMSLRDYFAGQVLNGAMGNIQFLQGALIKASEQGMTADNWLAQNCYEMADAMLAERAK